MLKMGLTLVALLGLTRAAAAHDAAGSHETTTRKFEMSLPNAPGKKMLAVEVNYPPGASTPSHTHEKSAFIYATVLSGEVESGMEDESPRLYRAGESWYERPGARHTVSRNASKTKPAKILAVFVADESAGRLTFPDPR